MTYGGYTHRNFPSGLPERQGHNPIFPVLLSAAALAWSSLAGLWILHSCPSGDPLSAGAPTLALPVNPTPLAATLATTTPAAMPPLRRYAGLLDPALTGDHRPVSFARIAALRSSFDQAAPPAPPAAVAELAPTAPQPAQAWTVVAKLEETPATEALLVPPAPTQAEAEQTIPLPVPRPATLLPGRANVAQNAAATPRDVKTGIRPESSGVQSVFDKLFGTEQPTGPALAYAAPEDRSVQSAIKTAFARPGAVDSATAVYDIAAHTVYLPDGTRLEAHSGLGNRLDDPRGVAERMRGPTPPNIYQLGLREQLFHGVRALRLTPVGDKPTYGRAGLLAHTYMLGARGDSNGCVVFKNYKAFLQAYDTGAVKRLEVVERLN